MAHLWPSHMKVYCFWLSTVAMLVPLAHSGAAAAARGDETGGSGRVTHTRGQDGGFSAGVSEEQNGRPVAPVSGGRALSDTYDDYSFVPTCVGNNGPDGADALCQAAVSACPADNEIRMWVYVRTVTRATGATTAWALAHPPIRCVGPDEPVVDPRVLIEGMIRSEFESRAVTRATVETNPAPRSLVNVPTRLETPTAERYDLEFSLLGQSVVISVQAEKWTWHTGDGTTLVTMVKGTRGRVEHTYLRAGVHEPFVVVEWSGTYSVNGQAQGAVPGRVTTQGIPGRVDVREARTELVDQ